MVKDKQIKPKCKWNPMYGIYKGEKRKVNIKIEDQNIEQVSKTKSLGVIIDEQLNWKEHILYMSNKLSKAIGVIIKARPLRKKSTPVIMLQYDILIWPAVVRFGEQNFFTTLTCYIDSKRKLSVLLEVA